MFGFGFGNRVHDNNVIITFEIELFGEIVDSVDEIGGVRSGGGFVTR